MLSRKSKKGLYSTKIQISPYKMRFDGTIILMHLDLACPNMREVLSGNEFEMNTLQTKDTHSGAKMVPTCVILDRDKLETAGSWQQLVH